MPASTGTHPTLYSVHRPNRDHSRLCERLSSLLTPCEEKAKGGKRSTSIYNYPRRKSSAPYRSSRQKISEDLAADQVVVQLLPNFLLRGLPRRCPRSRPGRR